MRSIKCVVIGDGAVGKTSLLISYTTNTFPTDYIPTVFDNYSAKIAVRPPSSLQPGNIQSKNIKNNDANQISNKSSNHNTESNSKKLDEVPNDNFNNDNIQFFKLNLWDTAGQDEYDKLRPLSYPQTDIFLICFSVTDRTSFNNLKEKWLNELKQHANIDKSEFYKNTGSLPVLIVGTKADLRENGTSNSICENSDSKKDVIDIDEIEEFIKENKLLDYCECSAMNQTGVEEVFQAAVKGVVYKELEIEQERVTHKKSLEEEKSKQTISTKPDVATDPEPIKTDNEKNKLKPVISSKSSKSTKSGKSSKSTNIPITKKITSTIKPSKKKSSNTKKTGTNNSKSTGNDNSNKKSKDCIIV